MTHTNYASHRWIKQEPLGQGRLVNERGDIQFGCGGGNAQLMEYPPMRLWLRVREDIGQSVRESAAPECGIGLAINEVK